MEIKRILPVLIFIFFIFGLMMSGITGYSLGLEKVKFVTEIPEIIPKEIFMRAGEVEKIEGNIIYLEAKVLTGALNQKTGEFKTEVLKIRVDENATFSFVEEIRSAEQKEAKMEDIKTGSFLYVSSLENIRDKKEFSVNNITIFK